MTNTELAAEFGIADSGIVQGRDCVIEIIKRSYGASELSQALIRVFPPPPKPKEEEPVIVMKGYSGLPVYTYEDAKKAEAEGLVSFDMVMPSAGDLEWQERALCAQTDPEAFFPEKGGSTREAKRVCTTCDVRVDCLEYALKNDERFGIWGGLSERERRRLKKASV
jgi:WhiB family redox-sensing transcriptional regulator